MKAKPTAEVSTNGLTGTTMTENGKMAKSMAMASGKAPIAPPTLAIGKTTEQMATARTSGPMEISTRATGKILSSMAKATTNSATETHILATTTKVSPAVRASTNGRTVLSTKALSKKARNTAKENGLNPMGVPTWGNTKMTKRMDMECLNGHLGMCMKGSIRMTLDMGRER